jgi:hypothetical protein
MKPYKTHNLIYAYKTHTTQPHIYIYMGKKTIVSSVNLQHRTSKDKVLYFISSREPKPKLNEKSRGVSRFENENMISVEVGRRMLFSTQPSPLDVVKVS